MSRQNALAIPIFFAVLLTPVAQATTVSASVHDTSDQPVFAATLTVNGITAAPSSDGKYQAVVPEDDVYRVQVTAPGFYTIRQTFSRADAEPRDDAGGHIRIPPIVLVRLADKRRLLVFAGDTMMARRYLAPRAGEPVLIRPATRASDMRALLREMRPYLELADFAFVNLETQLAATLPPHALPKSVTFHTHPDIAAALRWAGVDYVALGNNHTWDYLGPGLETTLAALNAVGLPYSGAGWNDAAARRPYRAEVRGLPVNLLSYVGWPGPAEALQVATETTGGAALGTGESVREDLAALPASALNVVQQHAGLEYVSDPPLSEETLLKSAVDHGADLAIGHHSHVVQGFEVYRDSLIAYSLGNFVFDQYLPSTHAAMLVYAWFDDDRFHRAEVVPLHINGYVPTPATGQMRFDILQRLARLSARNATCTGGSGGHLTVHACKFGRDLEPPQSIDVRGPTDISRPVNLRRQGGSATSRRFRILADRPYRLGLDLLRRGDFEYRDLFGTTDRYWIESADVDFPQDGQTRMRIRVAGDQPVRAGMKVFTRVFTRSAPATVSASVSTDECVALTALLQRRPEGEGFEAALAGGPTHRIGETRLLPADSSFSFDFKLPRGATKSVRLLLDAEPCAGSERAATLTLDELVLIEWQTPWIPPDLTPDTGHAEQATHLQLSR